MEGVKAVVMEEGTAAARTVVVMRRGWRGCWRRRCISTNRAAE